MRSFLLATAILGLAMDSAHADGDAAKGEKVAKACAACHSFNDKTNKVGPYLLGVFGRAAATAEGYNYSAAMKSYGATGAVWDEAALDKYLENPRGVVPGARMAFAGVKKPGQRADLIAFLKTRM